MFWWVIPEEVAGLDKTVKSVAVSFFLVSKLPEIWLLLRSNVPPSCGDVSETKSVLIPDKLLPSPAKEVAVQTPDTVNPPDAVSAFLVPLWY